MTIEIDRLLSQYQDQTTDLSQKEKNRVDGLVDFVSSLLKNNNLLEAIIARRHESLSLAFDTFRDEQRPILELQITQNGPEIAFISRDSRGLEQDSKNFPVSDLNPKTFAELAVEFGKPDYHHLNVESVNETAFSELKSKLDANEY